MKLLLHSCCGPCSCYPTQELTEKGVDFTLLYYNPNIHPYREFKHRLAALRELAEKKEYKLIIDKTYPLEECMQGMLSEPGIRCAFCYRMRMRYAAAYAAQHGYDVFSTTLLYSPYQKHELLKRTAEEAALEFGVTFFYQDWRPYYQAGVDISLELGLYRQPYCGCIFSERDRYMEVRKRGAAMDKVGDTATEGVTDRVLAMKTDFAADNVSGTGIDAKADAAGNVKATEEKFVRISKNIIQLQKQAVILYK